MLKGVSATQVAGRLKESGLAEGQGERLMYISYCEAGVLTRVYIYLKDTG